MAGTRRSTSALATRSPGNWAMCPCSRAPTGMPRLPDRFEAGAWAAFVEHLDAHIAQAISRDIADRQISTDDIAAGYSLLAGLRLGLEPDYEQRGLGTAYLFQYVGQRAASVAIACTTIPSLPN